MISFRVVSQHHEFSEMSACSRLKVGQKCSIFETSPPGENPETAFFVLNRNEQMEATSDEVEVKNLLVARYLERLNEARQNLKIRVQKIEHLVKTQDVYVSKGLSGFTVT